MARPRVELEDITVDGWKLLDSLVIWGTQEFCAEQLNISVPTLTSRIKERYGVGFLEYKDKRRERIKINLMQKQYEMAMNGNVTLLVWLGKNLLGQSDKSTVSTTDKPFKLNYNFDTEPEEDD